ncbi:FkbM family methyltransferase [Hymenobacter negativus]|uniref:FkbM family methyltransferase n=1 Tax=Hymenobacter negativus TaxID=2795026 RepID=A0ABS0Q5Z7_9BACT|nr:FkbM family methyltransferase [Hymenobacter negativus]MBH8558010.1 FkbM family methyltransferase [Hymenobacter negativus]
MKIRNKQLLFLYCKLRYLRNQQTLKSLKVINEGRFFIYDLGDIRIASESFSWYLTRAHLAKEVKRVSAHYYTPQPGDTVVDVGAGLGEETSIYTDLVGPAGRVYAIEANPAVYQVLRQLIEDSQLRNVKLFNLAINDKPGPVIIDDAPTSYLSSSLNSQSAGTAYEVPGLPFEDFCAAEGIRRIDLLKINIEGAERFFSTVFARPELDIPNVAIACHDFRFEEEGNEFFRTKQLVIDYLQANGYDTWSQETGTRYIDDWVYGRKLPV